MIVLAIACWFVGTALIAWCLHIDHAKHRARLLRLRAAHHDDRLRNVTHYVGPTYNAHGTPCEQDIPAQRRIM